VKKPKQPGERWATIAMAATMACGGLWPGQPHFPAPLRFGTSFRPWVFAFDQHVLGLLGFSCKLSRLGLALTSVFSPNTRLDRCKYAIKTRTS